MQKMLKKIIVSALIVSMMLPLGSIVASSESSETDNTNIGTENESPNGDETNTDDTDDGDKDELVSITEEEAFAKTKLITENSKLAMYLDEENERIALRVKETGYIWWSSPFNADADPAGKKAQRESLKSSISIKYGDIAQRRRSDLFSFRDSTKKNKTKFKEIKNGIQISYNFNTAKASFPVSYVLNDDYMEVSVDTTKIEEKSNGALDGRVLTNLQILPQMGAGSSDETGYTVIPDGSGTVINFNNQKAGYYTFGAQVYGNDLTPSPLTAPKVTEQVYMPVFGIVKENNALVAIATKGDSNASIRATVSGQSGSSYNNCYFDFELRSTDNYYMTGEAAALLVFEKNGIKVPELAVRYYPITKENASYVDVAETYRNYLIAEKNLQKVTEANTNPLYIDIFGGVVKKTSVLGIPLNLRTSITSFNETSKIVNELSSNGANDIVLNYNDWTNNQIKGNLSTNAKPASTLGGKSDFEDMLENFKAKNVEFYPAVDNIQFNKSSAGFVSFTNTAIRISNAYSRQESYDLAYGTVQRGKAPSLLTPSSYAKVIEKTIKGYNKRDLNTISLGSFSDTLVSNFSNKDPMNRNDTMQLLIESYKKANDNIGKVLADSANAYVIPYASHITNVPVSSSGYDLTDYDVPFYQIVLHGYVPMSSTPLNKSADYEKTFLLGIASGTSVHYDFINNSASDIMDTDYDSLFYATYEGWINQAVGYQNFANEIIKSVSDQTITGYEFISDDEIKTTYSNGTVTIVNTKTAEVTLNGKKFALSEYVREG